MDKTNIKDRLFTVEQAGFRLGTGGADHLASYAGWSLLKNSIREQEAQIVTLIGAAEDLLNETTRKNAEGWTSLGLAGEELENAIAAIITGEKT